MRGVGADERESEEGEFLVPPSNDGEGDGGGLSDGDYLSDGGGLSDGENLPPRQQRYIRAVKQALRGTLRDLGSLELELIGERLKETISDQREGLSRLVDRVQKSRAQRIPKKVRSEIGVSTPEQRRKLREVIGERRRKLEHQLKGVDRQMRRTQRRVQSSVRKVMTGDASRRVRDYFEQNRTKPTFVKLLDKSSFFMGVTSLLTTEFILLYAPEHFWAWYTVFMTLMIAARIPSYTHKRWHYFMYDFCYYAQCINLLQCLFLPKACWLFKVNYAFAMGPLLMAVILWRNSLVFHDVDKVITVYIHVLPSWLWFVVRWLTVDLPDERSGRLADLEQCGGFGWRDYLNCCFMYILWQILYFLKTEVWDAHILNADPTIQTSLRWLAVDSSKGIHQLVLYLMRKGKFMKPDEKFNLRTFKTKFIFMLSQFCYTAIVLLPTPLHYTFFPVSALYVTGVFGVAIYNGGEYYIEVFSRRYYSQFEGEAKSREPVRDPDLDPPVASDDEAQDEGDDRGGGAAQSRATSSSTGAQRKSKSPRNKRSTSANRMMRNRAARANSDGTGTIGAGGADSGMVSGGGDGSVRNWGVGDGNLEGSIEEPPPIVSDGEDEMDELVEDFYDLLMEEGGGELGNGKDPPSELIEDEVVGKIVDRYEQKEKAETQVPTDETKKAK